MGMSKKNMILRSTQEMMECFIPAAAAALVLRARRRGPAAPPGGGGSSSRVGTRDAKDREAGEVFDSLTRKTSGGMDLPTFEHALLHGLRLNLSSEEAGRIFYQLSFALNPQHQEDLSVRVHRRLARYRTQ